MFSSLLVALWMTYGAAGAFKEPLSSLRFIQEPTSTVARKNEPVTLYCQIGGSLQAKIRWTRNGETIHEDSRRTISRYGALQINNVVHKRDYKPDVGEYQCFASITVGTIASRKVHLDVAVMSKKFLYEPQDTTTWEGSVGRFSCQIRHSLPPAEITWEKDGILLNSSERIIILNTGVLQIANVTRADEGKYRCMVKNIARTRFSQYGRLTVQTVAASVEPTFLGSPANVSVIKGSTSVIDCAATGNPVPLVSWKKRDGALIATQLKLPGIANLNITNSEKHHGGEYVCQASSGGKTISRSVWIFVKAGPQFTTEPSNIRRTSGQVISLSCGAKGVPVPMLSWLRNGNKLRAGGQIKLSPYEGGMDLTITNITSKDTGMYQCFAENEVEMIQTSASVIVHSAGPGPPTNIVALPESSSAILINWSAPAGNYKIQAFTVHSQNLDVKGSPETQEVVGNDTHSYVVTRLQGYTRYSFYVTAYTSTSFGMPSQKVEARTLEGIPRAPPTDIKVSSNTPDSLDVTWQPPRKDLQNGIITKYIITYEEIVPDARSLPRTVEVVGNTLTKTINGVKKGKTYKVEVKAATKEGEGPSSTVFGQVLMQPTNVISAPTLWISEKNTTFLKVEWLPPKYGEGHVKEYHLFYVQLEDGKMEKGPVVQGKDKRSFTLRGLSADSQFLIKMMAWDGHSLGKPGAVRGITVRDPHASPSPFVSPAGLPPPSRPINLVCTVESPTSLLVTWERPLSARMIAFYIVKYHPRNNLNPKPVEKKTLSENIILTGLYPGRDYTISVRSHYSFEVEGPFPGMSTTQRHCIIPENKPFSPPRNIKYLFKSVRSVEITWERPDGRITGYTLLYTYNLSLPLDKWESQHEKLGFLASHAKVFSTVLTRVKENTTFYLKVCAENNQGKGPFSKILIVQPPSSKQRGVPNVTYTKMSQSRVQLSWHCPRVFDVLITSFTVLSTKDKSLPEDQWTRQTVVFDSFKRFPNIVSTMLELEPNRTFHIKVRAEYDDFVPGPWSMLLTVSTYAKDHVETTVGGVLQPTGEPNSSEQSPDFHVKLGVIIGCTISAFCMVLLILFIVWRNPCRQTPPTKKKEKSTADGHLPINGFLATNQLNQITSTGQSHSESTEEASASSGMCQCRCTCGAGARWPLGPTIVRTNNHLPGSSDSSTPLAHNSRVFMTSVRKPDKCEESRSHQEFNCERDSKNSVSSLRSLPVEFNRDEQVSTIPAQRNPKQSISVDV